MKTLHKYICFYALTISLLGLMSGCITEDMPDNDTRGNFEACWRILDEHYCFFQEKHDEYGLDWNEVYQRYSARVTDGMTNEQLFEVLAEMTKELRDGHVNLYANHDVSRYGAWFDDYPLNYYDFMQRTYLGRSEEYKQTSSLQYRILPDNIGYVRCSTFSTMFGDGNLSEIIRQLAGCTGLIVDIRDNGGGQLTAAQKLASVFTNEKLTVGYMCHKTGRGHSDFSSPQAVEVEPFPGLRWQKRVCILTNRHTYSAANSFTMYVKGLPGVTVVGDRTGGGAGMPFSSELPNGWFLRFSACPMYDRNMNCTETGIDPDVKVDISDEDFHKGIDTIIETARAILKG